MMEGILRVHAHSYAQGLGFYSISTICQSAEYIAAVS